MENKRACLYVAILTGRSFLVQNPSGRAITIDTSTLPDGIYLVRQVGDGCIGTARLVVRH